MAMFIVHLTMSCVQKHNKEMTVEDVTMVADTYTLLMPNQLHFLHQKELLEIIVAKLKVIGKPSVFHHSSKYRLLAIICNDKLQIAMILNN